VSTLPGNHEVKELQKTAILGTAHILRKVLIEKCIRANAAASDMSTINSSDRIAATLYSLGTWFVSGIYVQIPCIKEIIPLPIILIIIIIKVLPSRVTQNCNLCNN
jgi:hypothetical protein